MTLSRDIFKNVMAQLTGRLYTSAVSFVITMVLLARILTTEDFGIFNYYLTFYYIFMTIIDFGSNTIAVREASKDPDRLPGLLGALVRMRAVLSMTAFIIVSSVATVVETDKKLLLLILLANLHLCSYSLGGYNAVFHVKMRFEYVAVTSGIGHTIFFLLSGLAYLAGSTNPAVYLVAYAVGMVGTNAANYFFSRRFVPKPDRSAPSEMRALFREALPLGLSSVMVTVYFYIDTVLLRPLQGEAAVGYYNAAYRILVFSIMVPVLFNQVVFPVYSRYFGNGGQGLSPIFRRAVLYMGVTGIPAATALYFFAEPLVVLVCGETYRESGPCLAVLGLAMATIFLTYPHTSILVASGRQILFAWIAAAGGLFNLALNLYLIPKYSYMGAAWATVVTELLVLLSAVYCVHRFTRVTAFNRELHKVLLVTGLVGLSSYLLNDQHLALALPVVGVVYVGSLFVFKLLPFDMHDEDRD